MIFFALLFLGIPTCIFVSTRAFPGVDIIPVTIGIIIGIVLLAKALNAAAEIMADEKKKKGKSLTIGEKLKANFVGFSSVISLTILFLCLLFVLAMLFVGIVFIMQLKIMMVVYAFIIILVVGGGVWAMVFNKD